MRVIEVQKLEGKAYSGISVYVVISEVRNIIIPFRNVYILVQGIVQIQNGTTADTVIVYVHRREAGSAVEEKSFTVTTNISGANNYQSIPFKTLFKVGDKVETQITVSIKPSGSSTAFNVQFTKAKIYIILP
jgi:hypothetical protein